ncbi:putative ligase protein [Echinococcus granulosus]|uniref:E3 ubiquitin-protein ligase n=1 Tax=Echinococcus granulosus TaxID=6210 RepID=U6IX34_ECHGR|nr:RING finger protein [Echinococcus granulosus]EUB58418.1 RING finger protein [Echinococcus granulosus]KAH9286259.1 putative ligase protein [Echinococcus granulosus]CDS16327.1 E3 ubiquitin protein ligase RNF146 [Echinococcus granulosus]
MAGGDSGGCPICLQPLLQPVEIPCGHVFCYLCIKGSASHRRRCPLCRRAFSMIFFENPNIIRNLGDSGETERPPLEFMWYYEGHNGWWQYDERTAVEIEAAYAQSLPRCEVFIAGHFYVVDFANMCQYRKDHSGRSRRIKRGSVDMSKKGIAGIRLSLLQPSEASEAADDEENVEDRGSISLSAVTPTISSSQRTSDANRDCNSLRQRTLSTTSSCTD